MHPIDDHRLPGIGPMRRARLQEAGVRTLEALVEADPRVLAQLPGFHLRVVERARLAAIALLESPSPGFDIPDVPDVPPLGGPAADDEDEEPLPSHRLRRGLNGARRIEATLDHVRQARSHSRTGTKNAAAKALRKELKRLRKVLERLQRECITHGLSRRAKDDLHALLDALDATLQRYTSRKTTKKRALETETTLLPVRRALQTRLD